MITPKLTALMVTMSLLGAGGPIAAMAQATADNDALQAIGVETGRNAQDNSALVAQDADNEIEISSEAESEANSEADSEAESEAEGKKKSSSEAESEADSEAESEAEAATIVEDSVIVANNNQNATVNQANVLDDSDTVTVTATQIPVQTGIAADVEVLGDLLVLLGLDGAAVE
jgi:hypothetical protein